MQLTKQFMSFAAHMSMHIARALHGPLTAQLLQSWQFPWPSQFIGPPVELLVAGPTVALVTVAPTVDDATLVLTVDDAMLELVATLLPLLPVACSPVAVVMTPVPSPPLPSSPLLPRVPVAHAALTKTMPNANEQTSFFMVTSSTSLLGGVAVGRARLADDAIGVGPVFARPVRIRRVAIHLALRVARTEVDAIRVIDAFLIAHARLEL